MGQEWRGGDIQTYPGGGFKLNLIKPLLEKWKDNKDIIVMFVDRLESVDNKFISTSFSYDVIFSSDAEGILQKFKDFDVNIVFSAEQYCWPDQLLSVSVQSNPFNRFSIYCL